MSRKSSQKGSDKKFYPNQSVTVKISPNQGYAVKMARAENAQQKAMLTRMDSLKNKYRTPSVVKQRGGRSEKINNSEVKHIWEFKCYLYKCEKGA